MHPSPNHPFWQQFERPQKAYWNMAAAIRRYSITPHIPCPIRPDYMVMAWEMAHGRPIPDFLQRQ